MGHIKPGTFRNAPIYVSATFVCAAMIFKDDMYWVSKAPEWKKAEGNLPFGLIISIGQGLAPLGVLAGWALVLYSLIFALLMR